MNCFYRKTFNILDSFIDAILKSVSVTFNIAFTNLLFSLWFEGGKIITIYTSSKFFLLLYRTANKVWWDIGITLSAHPSVCTKYDKVKVICRRSTKFVSSPYVTYGGTFEVSIAYDLMRCYDHDPGSVVQVKGQCLKMLNSCLGHILYWKMVRR